MDYHLAHHWAKAVEDRSKRGRWKASAEKIPRSLLWDCPLHLSLTLGAQGATSGWDPFLSLSL